jgi:glycosyltransferase involved in cell wall biosynthesis
MGLKMTKVYQMLPSFSYGDAIGKCVIDLYNAFKELNYETGIYARHINPLYKRIAKNYIEYIKVSDRSNIIMYHFSIGSPLSDFIKKLKDKKILIYHNITPSYFFKGINSRVETECRMGREEIETLVNYFDMALGVSEFNRIELEEMGFKNTGVLPLFIDRNAYNTKFNYKIIDLYNDDWINIIHVGRIAPNKRIEDVIKIFYFYKKINPLSRLFIIGNDIDMENYSDALRNLIDELNISDVYFPGHISFEDMVSYYKIANIYICMSEHEGFCLPLLESMHFGIPIIAYKSSGIPFTLKDSGIMVPEKRYEEIAELIDVIMNDEDLKKGIISKQYDRLMDYDSNKLKNLIEEIISSISF